MQEDGKTTSDVTVTEVNDSLEKETTSAQKTEIPVNKSVTDANDVAMLDESDILNNLSASSPNSRNKTSKIHHANDTKSSD